jgi:soluble lytic murein transglycosylase-like protein
MHVVTSAQQPERRPRRANIAASSNACQHKTDSRHSIDVIPSDTKDSLRATRPQPPEFRQSTEVNTVSRNHVVASPRGLTVASVRTIRRAAPLVLGTIMFTLVGCTEPTAPPTTTAVPASTATTAPATALGSGTTTLAAAPSTPSGAQPRLASDPAQLADDLVADELALRDPSTAEAALVAAAHRQQAAYRAIGQHPEWDAITRPRIPPSLLEVYDPNIDARRQLTAMAHVKDTLPAWRIEPPAPAGELLSYYHEAESESGVGWNYLAAINLIETRFGSIVGVSTAGAQGPMQFLPSTFAAYGEGGDIHSPRDSIMAAGRYLAANGFANDRDHAIYRYNNANEYVRAVNEYAAVLAADPVAFAGYYRWDVYYYTTAGDVLLPIGYAAMSPIPVGDYLATHPQ